MPGSFPPTAETYVEVETVQREIGFRKLPTPKLEGLPAIKRILGAFELRYAAVPRAFNRTIGPVVQLLNRRRLATRPGVDLIEFGELVLPRNFQSSYRFTGDWTMLNVRLLSCQSILEHMIMSLYWC